MADCLPLAGYTPILLVVCLWLAVHRRKIMTVSTVLEVISSIVETVIGSRLTAAVFLSVSSAVAGICYRQLRGTDVAGTAHLLVQLAESTGQFDIARSK